MAGPGVIMTLTFAPLVIAVFFSAKFGAAVEILRWICLGTMLQVITWPMGFIIVAKGRQNVLFCCEAAWAAVSLGLAWVCVRSFGLNGAGIAFFGSYVFHAFLIYPVVNRLSGFRWNRDNLRTARMFLFLIALVFSGFHMLPFAWAASLGTLSVVGSGIYSFRVLSRLVSLDQLPHALQRLLARLGFVSSSPVTVT